MGEQTKKNASKAKFLKIVCEGEKVRTRGCISSSPWYKLSFEPSTNSVRFVLFLYYKFMQQKSIFFFWFVHPSPTNYFKNSFRDAAPDLWEHLQIQMGVHDSKKNYTHGNNQGGLKETVTVGEVTLAKTQCLPPAQKFDQNYYLGEVELKCQKNTTTTQLKSKKAKYKPEI